jgi:hypothetical protein
MLKLRSRSIFKRGPRSRGQSFLELALVLPILLLMLLGLVEVAFFMGKYLDALDLTREAARFASIREPYSKIAADFNCFTGERFEFYWDTSCIFSPPEEIECTEIRDLGSGNWLKWCNGLNKYLAFNPATDDVVITVFTVDKDNNLTQNPNDPQTVNEYTTYASTKKSYYWALSNHIQDGTYHQVDNWKKDCKGNTDNNKTPFYTIPSVSSLMNLNAADFPSGMTVGQAPGNKGFVAVEVYYCHTQTLGLPVFTLFVPNPMMIHAYTLMPLPAAAPTPTAKTP